MTVRLAELVSAKLSDGRPVQSYRSLGQKQSAYSAPLFASGPFYFRNKFRQLVMFAALWPLHRLRTQGSIAVLAFSRSPSKQKRPPTETVESANLFGH